MNPLPPPPSPLPADRGNIATEQRHPASQRLHELDAAALVRLFAIDGTREVLAAMEAATPALAALAAAIEPRFAAGGRLIYLGAGTSGRLGVLDASELPPTFQLPPDRAVGIIAGGDASLRRSSEGREDELDGATGELDALRLDDRDSVIGIAAGGTTPYVQGALAIAKRRAAGCLTALITCAAVPAPPACDHLVLLPTGPELLTGSTRMKAGTATKLALNAISTALMVRMGKVHGNLMVDVRASNLKLRDRAARIVQALTGLPRAACFALLDDAGGAVKTAVVMHRCACGRADAEARLAAADGRLDRALSGSGPAPGA